jgi:predicted metalloprotease
MDLKKQILVALGLDKGEEVNMEWQAKSEDGTIFVSTADELAESVDISILTEDGSTILLPPGTYKTEDGVTFRVEEEGIVAEVMETEEVVEEEVEEEEMEEVVEPENLEARIKSLEDAVASLIGEPKEELAEEVVEVEERGTTPKSIKTTEVVEFSIEDLKAENERLKTELAAQPASAPLDTNKFSSDKAAKKLTNQEIKRMTQQERFLYNLNN